MPIGDIFTSETFGRKPKVAPFVPTDLSAEQKKAVGEDISNFGDISTLGNLYSSYLQSSIEKQLPGYSALLKEGSATSKKILDQAQPLLSGQIPQDVQDQIQRSDAFKSFSGGFGGSQMSAGLTARDLGLTSLNLINQGATLAGQGENATQQWARLAGSTTYDPSSMFVTPSQQAAITSQNNQMQQATQQMQYNVDAAPDPRFQGVYNTVMSLLSMYTGGGGSFGNRSGGAGTSSGGSGSSASSLFPDESMYSYGAM